LASAGEDDVERRLLLGSGLAAPAARGGNCDRSGGGDAPLLFDLVLQLDQLEDGHRPELLEDCVNCSHWLGLLILSGGFFGRISLRLIR